MFRLAIAAVAAALLLPAAGASARTNPKPTIVMVHGAFADASGFGAVTNRLQDRGYTVISPPNQLRGPANDAAYVASVMKTIDGPIVLVAHSYGGAVITNAATNSSNVVGLVYVAAFAPEQGEVLGVAVGDSKDSVLNSALVPQTYPTGNGTDTATEFVIDAGLLTR